MTAIIAQVVQRTQAHRHTGRARKGKGARFGDEWVSCLENPVGNLSINATTNPLSASPSLLNLHQLFHELSAFVPEIWSKASGILRSLPRRRMRDKIFVWRALSFQRETDPRQNFSNPDSSLLICRQMSKPSPCLIFIFGSAMMSNNLVLTTCIGHCIKRATEKIQSIKVHLACCRALRRLQCTMQQEQWELTRVSAFIYCLMKWGTIMAQYTLTICHYDFVSAELVH